MGSKDLAEKILFDYNDVFADIINNVIFNGEQVVKEDELENVGVHNEHRHVNDGKLHETERDVLKVWKKGGVRFALFGLENQTVPEYDMAMRVFGYEGNSYNSQVHSSSNERYPVVTIILYFGEKPWNCPKKLSDMLRVPEQLKPYFNDFHINVIEVGKLTDEQIAKFKSDFRAIAQLFADMQNARELRGMDEFLVHSDESCKLLSTLTSNPDIYRVYKGKGDAAVSSLEDYLHGLLEQGREKGIEQGADGSKREIVTNMFKSGMDTKQIAKVTGIPFEEVFNIVTEAQSNDEAQSDEVQSDGEAQHADGDEADVFKK